VASPERIAYALIFSGSALAIPIIPSAVLGIEFTAWLAGIAFQPAAPEWLHGLLFVATPLVLLSFAGTLLVLRPLPLAVSTLFAAVSALLLMATFSLPEGSALRCLVFLQGTLLGALTLRARIWAHSRSASHAA